MSNNNNNSLYLPITTVYTFFLQRKHKHIDTSPINIVCDVR